MQDPHARTWYEGAIVSKAETPRSHIVQTKSGIVRRNRIHLKKKVTNRERSESGKVAGKAKGSAKGTCYPGKCNRPSVVKVLLVKSQNESIKESDKMEGKIPRFVPKGIKKRKRKVKVRK